MTATLHVLSPGLCTLIVDRGRPRTRSLGVPVGGAADCFALAIGNALVGNEPDAAALEIALGGPVLRADAPLACALVGAPFEVRNGRRILRANSRFTLDRDEELVIAGTPVGARAYLCVRHGIDARPILDSRSSLQPLRGGERVACTSDTCVPQSLVPQYDWNAEPRCLRCLPGAQADWFPANVLDGSEWTVTPASNRMGLRLQGAALEWPGRELVSEPVCPGTVQVTREGQPIVLGVDGQTIGGYPKIAQVVSADVDKLAQLRPGDRVTFHSVTLDEAEELHRRKQAELDAWLLRIRTAADP